MATIKEIAKLANVSPATVSNVLNRKKNAASPEKTQEIYDIVQRLNYHPNPLARGLKAKRSNTIGIIAEDLTVHHTSEIINGIEEYCEQQGYETLMVNMRLFKRFGNNFSETTEYSAMSKNILQSFVAKRIEGFPFLPPEPAFQQSMYTAFQRITIIPMSCFTTRKPPIRWCPRSYPADTRISASLPISISENPYAIFKKTFFT